MTYFKALADQTRVRLMHILSQYELNVNEIVEIMQMGQSRISRHLRILADAGLVRARRDGLWIFYSVVGSGAGAAFFKSIEAHLRSDQDVPADLVRTEQVIERRRQRTVQFFDTIASDWEQLRGELLGDFDLTGEIVRLLPVGVLTADLGCGSGDLLRRILVDKGPVIGVDRSRNMLNEARSYCGADASGLDLRIGELEHLPLRDGEVNAAVLNMVLHHLHAPLGAIQEASRIIKPGGMLIIADFLTHTREEMRQSHQDRWLGFTPDQIEGWLEESFFKLERKEAYSLKQDLMIGLYSSIKREF
ncbi:metalloregulator ArsR/SmtB family transcription factor [bacterium]|nr:metalloregulator ArsR/SmtB family transcription factor [bacterium]